MARLVEAGYYAKWWPADLRGKKQFDAHLIGFRGIGSRVGDPFGDKAKALALGKGICPAVVLRLPDGRKRCFPRGSFSDADQAYIVGLYDKEMGPYSRDARTAADRPPAKRRQHEGRGVQHTRHVQGVERPLGYHVGIAGGRRRHPRFMDQCRAARVRGGLPHVHLPLLRGLLGLPRVRRAQDALLGKPRGESPVPHHVERDAKERGEDRRPRQRRRLCNLQHRVLGGPVPRVGPRHCQFRPPHEHRLGETLCDALQTVADPTLVRKVMFGIQRPYKNPSGDTIPAGSATS